MNEDPLTCAHTLIRTTNLSCTFNTRCASTNKFSSFTDSLGSCPNLGLQSIWMQLLAHGRIRCGIYLVNGISGFRAGNKTGRKWELAVHISTYAMNDRFISNKHFLTHTGRVCSRSRLTMKKGIDIRPKIYMPSIARRYRIDAPLDRINMFDQIAA